MSQYAQFKVSMITSYTSKTGKCRSIIHRLRGYKNVRFWDRLDFGERAGFVAAVAVITATQIVLTLSLISQENSNDNERAAYARVILNSVASRTSGLIAAGDLLTVSSELNRLVASDLVAAATVSDVDGEPLVSVGTPDASAQYKGQLKIGPDLAGTLSITLHAQPTDEALRWTITGLSLVIAAFIFAATTSLYRAHTNRLWSLVARLSQQTTIERNGDPLEALDTALSALPLDLIDTTLAGEIDDTAMRSMAVVTLSLDHLTRYIDTLDEVSLVSYVATHEALMKAVSQMLGGNIQTNRPQSLSMSFEGQWRGMSSPLRATVSAALLQHLLPIAERSRRLKFSAGIGVSHSELSHGELESAYAGLYIQTAFDEAHALAQRAGNAIKLASSLSDFSDIATLFDTIDTADGDCQLGSPTEAFLPELEKQSRLLQRRLFPDVGDQADLPF